MSRKINDISEKVVAFLYNNRNSGQHYSSREIAIGCGLTPYRKKNVTWALYRLDKLNPGTFNSYRRGRSVMWQMNPDKAKPYAGKPGQKRGGPQRPAVPSLGTTPDNVIEKLLAAMAEAEPVLRRLNELEGEFKALLRKLEGNDGGS